MKKIRNPLTPEATGAATMAVPVFALAEMLFHVNPVSGAILAAMAALLGWNGHGAAIQAVDSCLNYKSPPARSKEIINTDVDAVQIHSYTGIVLGNDKFQKPVTRELEKLKNILILGLQGMGKSSLACWILSQMIVECGAQLIVIDPHARDDEGLASMLSPFESSFMFPAAYKISDIQSAIEYAANILEERIDKHDKSQTPIILVVDELTSYINDKRLSDLAPTIGHFNSMGRKYGCFSLCIGQLVNASRTGGTELRELFATKLLLGMRETQAKMLVDPIFAKRVQRLEPGECLCDLEGKDDPFMIRFPKKPMRYYKDQAKMMLDHSTTKSGKAHGQAQDFSDCDETTLDDHTNVPNSRESLVSANSNLRDIISRYKNGESIRSIAAAHGITSGDDRKALKQLLDAFTKE